VIVAGDVGGTKIVLEAGEIRGDAWEPALSRRYESAENTFVEAFTNFLGEWKTSLSQGKGRKIKTAAFGVAGPKTGNCIKMTNRPWSVDGDFVRERFGIPKVALLNDLEASAHGLELLPAREMKTIHAGKAVALAPRVVMGVGTGLGVAYLVACAGRYQAVPGEGGHASFAPVTPQQVELLHAIQGHRGRVSIEDILSGTGLSRIYQFTMQRGECAIPPPDALRPERISQQALDGTDAMCSSALDLFVECMGGVAGDHALNVMALGGVYLTGGIVAKILPRLKSERFAAAFCAKGAHSTILKRIPVKAVTYERLPVLGAAAFAAAL
jgi:glucokinase